MAPPARGPRRCGLRSYAASRRRIRTSISAGTHQHGRREQVTSPMAAASPNERRARLRISSDE